MLDFARFLDINCIGFIGEIRRDWLTPFFMFITYLGKWYVIVLLAVLFSWYLWKNKDKKYALFLWLGLAGTAISVSVLKFVIHRARPADSIYLESLPAFPSWHAAGALFFYGFLAFYFWRLIKDTIYKWVALKFFLIVIVLIGFSRLYLGVHYLSDVLGGYLAGGAWLAVAILFCYNTPLCRDTTENRPGANG